MNPESQQPQQGMGQPPQRMGQPQQGMGQPPQRMGQPQQGMGQPPQRMGQPQQGMGQPPQGMGQPQQGRRSQLQSPQLPQRMGQPQQEPVEEPSFLAQSYIAGGGWVHCKSKVKRIVPYFHCQECAGNFQNVRLMRYKIYVFAIFLLCYIKKVAYIQCPRCKRFSIMSGSNRRRAERGEDVNRILHDIYVKKLNREIKFISERVNNRSPKSRGITAFMMILWFYGIDCFYVRDIWWIPVRIALVSAMIMSSYTGAVMGFIMLPIMGCWGWAYFRLYTMRRKDYKGRYIMTDEQYESILARKRELIRTGNWTEKN